MLYYYCPKSVRGLREKQYVMGLKARSKLPQYITHVAQKVSAEEKDVVSFISFFHPILLETF